MPVFEQPAMPTLEELLMRLRGQAPAESLPEPVSDSLRGAEGYGGMGGGPDLLGLLAAQMGMPGGMGGGTGAGTGAGGYGTGGFVPTGDPGSATDYGGTNASLDDLLTRHGITGVPNAVRGLLRGARQTDTPIDAVSNAIYGSGFRTREQQAAAYAAYLNGTGNLAAPPGHSMHEVGRAFDISQGWLAQNPEYQDWLLAHNWEFPVTGEPWHAEWQGPAGQLNPPPRPSPSPGPTYTPPTPSSAPPASSNPRATALRRRQRREGISSL